MSLNKVEYRTEQAANVHAKYFGVDNHPQGVSELSPYSIHQKITESELIEKMFSANNGRAVRALWEGDVSAYDYDDSRADAALCAYLAYWTHNDPDRIDRMFRMSKLYRDKWDREDYRNRTINGAIRIVQSNGVPEMNTSQKESILEPWEPPIPFESYDLPPFPIHCLPDWVKDHVMAVAEDTQTSVDMAAVMALGLLSIPCAGAFKIEGKEGWREPLNLFCMTIAEPGERKSAVMAHMAKPIYEYESEENEYLKGEIAKSQSKRKILEGELNKLQSIAIKESTTSSQNAASAKADEIARFKDISPLRLTCDDVSPEKLARLIVENYGRMAIVSAEGGLVGTLEGRYSDKVNIDVFLKGHSGDPLRVDRIGREGEYVNDPALTIVLAAQPDVLRGIMKNETFRGRGLTARFLFSIPASKVGARNPESKAAPVCVLAAYNTKLRHLLKTTRPDSPLIIRLSSEAYSLSIGFAREIEPRLIDDMQPFADWASKLHGAILRIAGILHIAAAGDSACDYLVSGDTMQKAIDIGRYFIEHARAAFSLMGADKNTENCKYVLKWIKKQLALELKKRDIFRGNRGRFKHVVDIEPVLKQLCEYGYLREKELDRQGAGRKPDLIYQVNPSLFSS